MRERHGDRIVCTPSWGTSCTMIIAASAASLAFCTSPTRSVAADGPTTVVQETADAVVNVLADKSLSADQKRAQIETIATAHFDFATVARLTLARNWKQLTPAQQAQFVEEFRKHLSVTYGKRVEEYDNEKAVIIGDRRESGDDWIVKTRIIRPHAAEILADYRLRKVNDKWMVIDVIVEGVSLVANFRSQFQDIVSKDGPAKLIDLLHEKNVKGEPLKINSKQAS